MTLDAIDRRILLQLADGPVGSTVLRHVKQRIDLLVADGLARRVPHQGGRIPVVVEITAAGIERIERLAAADSRP